MAKGSAFEREICKKLSLWWSGGERDDIFYRTSASGARWTARKKTGKTTVNEQGDMSYSDPSGKLLMDNWSVEMKTGYAKGRSASGSRIHWCVLDIIDGKENQPMLVKFWKQTADGAGDKEPVLIFRRNQKQTCIVISHMYYMDLVSHFGSMIHGSVRVDLSDYHFDYVVVIMKLDHFLDWILDIREALG